MAYLINPGGRMVSVDDEKEFARLVANGFQIPSPEEEKDYIRKKTAEFASMKPVEEKDHAVYMATVTQGGKDGYSIASARLLEELRMLDVNIQTSNQGQKIALLFHNPYSILRLENAYRIIYTMFESDKIPADWHDYLEAADQVIVPSKWCQKVFKKDGIQTDVIPLGYDAKTFTYKRRINKRTARKDFKFLHYNAFNIRKGFPEVFKAFTQEFKQDEPVKLVLKTTLHDIPLPISKAQYPNIEILNDPISDKKLAELCWECDAFVFPSRGEGFGITPLEAMATGLPTIVPNAHGITEYFNPKYMYEVKVAETCPALYSRYKNQDVGKMVVCDVKDLRRQMRYIYEHQNEAIKMGQEASEYVKNWTFEKTGEKFKELFEKIYDEEIPDRPLRNVLQLEAVK